MTKTTYLAIQSSYHTTDIALIQDNSCLERRFYTDRKASSHLVPYIDSLLNDHGKSLSDLAFIAVDKGPGAFTTLRVTIATLNGIAFARNIPLIGIDGLKALSHEVFTDCTRNEKTLPEIIIIMLNAYNNDVYFLISSVEKTGTTIIDFGYKNINQLLNELSTLYSGKKIVLAGNALSLHQEIINQNLEGKLVISNSPLQIASATTIALLGFESFKAKTDLVSRIIPNYLKTLDFPLPKKN